MIETNIFFIGFIAFAVAFLIFKFFKRSNIFANLNLLVSLVTLTSYAVLFSTIGAIKLDCINYIYPTRWLFYIASCGILIYEVSLIMKKSNFDTFKMIVFNTVVMLNGFLASISHDLYRWIFFMISTLAFIMLLDLIHEKNNRENKFVGIIRWYVTIAWSIFPLVWILAPTGLSILNAFYAALLYLILDIVTKIIFGTITSKEEA